MMVEISCRMCGRDFVADLGTYASLQLRDLPVRCPICKDRAQNRPDEAVAESRRCLVEFPAVQLALPEWVSFSPFRANETDPRSGLRATIKGRDLRGSWSGVSWGGRLDIYCLAKTVPTIARVRVMMVTHAAGHRRVELHGVPMGPKESVEVAYSPEYTYLALEPSKFEVPTAALVLASVAYKTTLKGLGRQWHCRLSDQALWSLGISNSARSGRFGIEGLVAVVDDDHPVVAEQYGDVETEVRYDLSHPSGV